MNNFTHTDQFKALIAAQKAPLPWVAADDGAVFDANKDLVLQVDPDNNRSDLKVGAIARHMVGAINAVGGFLPSPQAGSLKGDSTDE